MDVRIGTSGWHYGHWRRVFYPADLLASQYLSYYAAHFSTVEVNNTFYRLPSAETVAAWVAGTPPDFVFAVKASGYITHRRRLQEPELTLQRFTDLLSLFGAKLGPVLFQLPPRFRVDPSRLEAFLRALAGGTRYAFEFRDASWFTEEVRELLARHGAAFCLYDKAGLATPDWVTAPFVYLRLHGASDWYQGRYTEQMLTVYAERIRAWVADGRDVYCYLNHDLLGNAVVDARRLIELVGETR